MLSHPAALSELFRGLEGADAYGLFQIFWLPFNLYLLIRLLQPSLRNRHFSQTIDLFIAIGLWVLWNAHIGAFSLLFTAANTHFAYVNTFLLLFENLVHCYLLVKASFVIYDLFKFSFSLLQVDSIITFVLRDTNLRLVLMARTIVGFLVVYVILSALNQYLSPYRELDLDVIYWWGVLSIPALIICFGIAILAMNRCHKNLLREIFSSNPMHDESNLEERLSVMASKRMSTQLIVNEIFMGQILKLTISALLTYSAKMWV